MYVYVESMGYWNLLFQCHFVCELNARNLTVCGTRGGKLLAKSYYICICTLHTTFSKEKDVKYLNSELLASASESFELYMIVDFYNYSFNG